MEDHRTDDHRLGFELSRIYSAKNLGRDAGEWRNAR